MKSWNELALQEKPECQHSHEGGNCGDHVGCHTTRREKPGGMECRHGPQVLGDEIGGALVSSHEHAPLDRAAVFGGDHHGIGRFTFAQ